jgi:hypothetical protein
VEDEELGEANVLIGSAWGTMLAVGAAAGGVVAAVLGRDVAFVVNAASFALSALLIVGIRRPFSGRRAHQHETPHGGLRGIAESIRIVLRFARGNRTLAALLLSKTTFGVGTGVIVLLAVFGRDVFDAGDAGIGILFAARGLGALIGLQRAAPDEIRGRVFSLDYGLVTLTIAGSTFLAGILADRVPPAVAVWLLVGLAAVAATGWILFSRPVWSNRPGRPAHSPGD